VAEKVAADLALIGIKAEIRPKELTVGLDEYRKGQWALATAGWSPDFLDANNQLVFLPGSKVGLRANWKLEANPELAELGKKAEVETDTEKRAELLQEIQRRMDEDSPFLVIVQHPARLAFRNDVQGVAWHENYKIEVYSLSK
jgi:peptide/nickel transport system substrate-binding protein